MIVYLDTSALIKLFVAEPETPLVADMLEQARRVFTHLIAYAEARAALAMALRMHRVTPKVLTSHKRALDQYWDDLDVVMPDIPLIRRAGDLAEMYALRGYDSVHLAAAERIARQGIPVTFACFDAHLNAAARSLGMEAIA